MPLRPGTKKPATPSLLKWLSTHSRQKRADTLTPGFAYTIHTEDIIGHFGLADRGKHKNAAIARAYYYTLLTRATGGFVTVRFCALQFSLGIALELSFLNAVTLYPGNERDPTADECQLRSQHRP